jgi:hypothetical protein
MAGGTFFWHQILTLTRPTRQLSPEDAAYLGGLIDGEGTISLTRRHAGERRQLVVSISSTEACILDWVLATWQPSPQARSPENAWFRVDTRLD